ncbi:MAG: hypothetical protein LBP89_07445, partial [Helicobacteraceae bacterium]|nr:hypothetical protein [Helicobacteraceae bacterium]
SGVKVAIVALIALFSFSGCVSKSYESQVISLDQHPSATLKLNFPQNDPISGKSLNLNAISNEVNYAINSAIRQFSFFPPIEKNTYRYYTLWGKVQLAECDAYSTCDYFHRGLDIIKNNHGYTLKYVNGTGLDRKKTVYCKSSSCKVEYEPWKRETRVTFEINVTKPNNNTIVFAYPRTCLYEPSSEESLADIERLKADVQFILDKLNGHVIKLKRNYELQGEISSQYSATAVYANFKRLLGDYFRGLINTEKLSDVNDSNMFAFEIAGQRRPLNISAYPYRNGSKTKYSVIFEYTIDSTGKTSVTPEQVKQARERIAKIIND